MKLKKVLLSIVIISIILVLTPKVAFAIAPAYKYSTVNVFISSIMETASIVLGIAYLIIAVIYFIKTKEQKTVNQQMKTLIIWLMMTVIIIIALRYFAPIVKEMGKTIQGPVRDRNGHIIVD